jgi:hypothetical protein
MLLYYSLYLGPRCIICTDRRPDNLSLSLFLSPRLSLSLSPRLPLLPRLPPSPGLPRDSMNNSHNRL